MLADWETLSSKKCEISIVEKSMKLIFILIYTGPVFIMYEPSLAQLKQVTVNPRLNKVYVCMYTQFCMLIP